ncbi:MAG: YihY family inner membrane protein [Pseudomonadota bacterium]|nr:YihY family inner membrane protein [Pseudomonadota bacterium]
MNLHRLKARARAFVTDVTDFPVLPTAATLWERFQQDRLGLTASSLTFTTTLALVPFFAVVLSIFTAFPKFGQWQAALQQWFIDSLVPASIAGPVLDYLTQFATKASELGLVGVTFLFFTVLSLILTIDETLNAIWRVSVHRPFTQRVLVYWAVLTLGPLVMGASLAITSYVVSRSSGWLPSLPGGVNAALWLLQFALMTVGITLLYRFVPYTPVRWQHALAGALFAALCLTLGRQALGLYLTRIPTYSLIYGTFATVPILLLWIYLSWLIVLFGAVIAAYLPSLLGGVARRSGGPGWTFRLAMETLEQLVRAREGDGRGLTLPQLTRRLRVDSLQLAPVLGTLQTMDWVGELTTRSENEEPRYVLLVDPARQRLRPLVETLLLKPEATAPASGAWPQALFQDLTVAQALALAPAQQASINLALAAPSQTAP